MPEFIHLTDPALSISVRRTPRARRISLRVTRIGGRVSMTLPPGVPLAEGQSFARQRAGWLRTQLAEALPACQVRAGQMVPVLGQPHLIVIGPHRRGVQSAAGQLIVPQGRPVSASVRAFLRDTARVHLTTASDRHAARIGRSFGRVTLRDTRSRWGSCTSEGNLMYSWRLAMAPRAVLDYVAAHEVAHLVHMDHSRAFWAVVEELCPDWRQHRDWLRAEGAGLQAIEFTD